MILNMFFIYVNTFPSIFFALLQSDVKFGKSFNWLYCFYNESFVTETITSYLVLMQVMQYFQEKAS